MDGLGGDDESGDEYECHNTVEHNLRVYRGLPKASRTIIK